MSRHLGVGTLSRRRSTSFGIFPIHLTAAGRKDPLFQGLNDPFLAVDSRDYQVTRPDAAHLKKLGVQVLALEKSRPHVPLDRAIMALRFTPEVVGTQFHPEADGTGMLHYMLTTERREQVIETHGEKKYNTMVKLLRDPRSHRAHQRRGRPYFPAPRHCRPHHPRRAGGDILNGEVVKL